jgi:hypothetical protein
MTDLFFEVFKDRIHHRMWDKHIEYHQRNDEISDELKKDVVSSLEFLKSEFGNGFLKNCPNQHPIYQKLLNKAENQLHEVVFFAKTLQYLKSHSNHSKLVEKLLPLDKCISEGVPFTFFSGWMLNEGFQVSFPEESNQGKCHDIDLLDPDSGDRICVEVSKLANSQKNIETSSNYRRLFHAFHNQLPRLPFSCIQLEPINESEFPQVLQDITNAKENAIEVGKIVTFISDKIDLAIVPHNQYDKLKEWCLKNQERPIDLRGLPINLDEPRRIASNKIRKEAKQIPSNETGLIVVPIDPKYLLFGDLREAIILYEKRMKEFPNLFGVLMYSRVLHTTEEGSFSEDSNYFKRIIKSGLCTDLFFVGNQFYNGSLSKETKERLLRFFT